MSDIIPETHLELTLETALEALSKHLEGKCTAFTVTSVGHLDGMDYWAFNVFFPMTFAPWNPMFGEYGYHVYNDGTVKQIVKYTETK
jgi:hypothetical protein